MTDRERKPHIQNSESAGDPPFPQGDGGSASLDAVPMGKHRLTWRLTASRGNDEAEADCQLTIRTPRCSAAWWLPEDEAPPRNRREGGAVPLRLRQETFPAGNCSHSGARARASSANATASVEHDLVPVVRTMSAAALTSVATKPRFRGDVASRVSRSRPSIRAEFYASRPIERSLRKPGVAYLVNIDHVFPQHVESSEHQLPNRRTIRRHIYQLLLLLFRPGYPISAHLYILPF